MKVNLTLKKQSVRSGFTLIELIASIAIISIISALAVSRYSTVITDGKTAKQTTVINAMESSKDLYAADESRTIGEIQEFNQKTAPDRFAVVKPYLRLNGVEPTSASLLEGTGKSVLDPGKITTAAYTTISGTARVTVAAEAGQAASLN
jgi:prepilin-type N-terminal cleavage/methylation domain-containing protein